MKIAISGKGGFGKTTLSSLIAMELSEQGKRVLAIDADPNGNLAEAVGYDAGRLGRIEPLIEKKPLVEERTGAKEPLTNKQNKFRHHADQSCSSIRHEIHFE